MPFVDFREILKELFLMELAPENQELKYSLTEWLLVYYDTFA